MNVVQICAWNRELIKTRLRRAAVPFHVRKRVYGSGYTLSFILIKLQIPVMPIKHIFNHEENI